MRGLQHWPHHGGGHGQEGVQRPRGPSQPLRRDVRRRVQAGGPVRLQVWYLLLSTYLQILSPRPPLQRPLPRPDAVSEKLHGEARPQEEQLPRLERPQGSLRPEVSFVEVIEVSHFSSHFSCERILIIVVYLQIKQKVWKLSKEVHRNKVSMWFHLHQLCHYPHYSPFSLPSNPHT